MRHIVLVIAIALLPNTRALAWETDSGIPAPSLVGAVSDALKITAIRVELMQDTIEVRYEGQNSSLTSVRANLSVYNNPYSWEGYAADYPALHFPEYQLSLNGNVLRKVTFTQAWHDGQDISATLRAHRIDPLLPADPEAAQTLDPRRKKNVLPLVSRGIFMLSDNVVTPNWLVQQNATWSLFFPPKAAFVLRTRYRARPATREVDTESIELAALAYQYCSAPDAIRRALGQDTARNPAAVRIAQFDIPLQMGNLLIPSPQFGVHVSAPGASVEPILTLSCGPESASLTGSPDIANADAGHKRGIQILLISAQRK